MIHHHQDTVRTHKYVGGVVPWMGENPGLLLWQPSSHPCPDNLHIVWSSDKSIIIEARTGLPGICRRVGASMRFANTHNVLGNRLVRDFNNIRVFLLGAASKNPELFSSCLLFSEPNNSRRVQTES